MSDDFHSASAGDVLFEAFLEQVKQVLERLYDFAYLQQHPLARFYDSDSDLSAKTAGRQLRHDVVKAIESLKPHSDARFRAPDSRLYDLLQLYYVENLTIQMVADELGLSERQAYRDLKRGQETVAAVLWNDRLPAQKQLDEQQSQGAFSLESEVARLKLNFRPIDVVALIQQARQSVERLAVQQSVTLRTRLDMSSAALSTDASLAHQLLVSLLSFAVQQMRPGSLSIHLRTERDGMSLSLSYPIDPNSAVNNLFDLPVAKLAPRLSWQVSLNDDSKSGERQIELHMSSSSATLLVIDDSDGWIELLDRYLEGSNWQLVAGNSHQDILQLATELRPRAIVLDVMMPERDGWEVLQRLRAEGATAGIPIIVCSIFDDPQLAYSLGASRFIPKPANRAQILDALQQLDVIQ